MRTVDVGKMKVVMSPGCLETLLCIYMTHTLPTGKARQNTESHLQKLEELQLVQVLETKVKRGRKTTSHLTYRATERADAYIGFLSRIPLPIADWAVIAPIGDP